MNLSSIFIEFWKIFLSLFDNRGESQLRRFDNFPFYQCLYRNSKNNNLLPHSPIDSLKIMDADENEITFNHLPKIPELLYPAYNNIYAKWALIVLDYPEDPPDPGPDLFDYENMVLINGGDLSQKKLYYTSEKKQPYSSWIGRSAALFNPFYSWEFRPTPLVEKPEDVNWCSKYISPAAFFKHSSGRYVMLINGENRKDMGEQPLQRIGAFISDTDDIYLSNWHLMNNKKPIFTEICNEHGFDSLQMSSLLESDEKGIFWGYCNARKGDHWKIIIIKFTEDFEIIDIIKNVFPDSANLDNYSGEYFPTVIKFQDKYRMIWVNRKEERLDWTLTEGISDSPTGPFMRISDGNVVEKVTYNSGHFRSSHSHQPSYFIWEDNLYCIIDGTSQYKTSGNRGNRVFGLIRYDTEAGQWYEYEMNPFFMNPMSGHLLWDKKWQWCADHLGGKQQMFVPQPDRPYFILIFSGAYGGDSYKIGCARSRMQFS